jgi:hypothetical protein
MVVERAGPTEPMPDSAWLTSSGAQLDQPGFWSPTASGRRARGIKPRSSSVNAFKGTDRQIWPTPEQLPLPLPPPPLHVWLPAAGMADRAGSVELGPET